MSQLVDRYGQVIARDRPATVESAYKRRRSPAALDVRMGDQYAPWAGRDVSYVTLPGGAMLQFDLSRLTMADFRAMRDHYQLNASLTVLTFVLHSIDWHIKCEDQEIADMIEGNMRRIWTRLIRALAQAFWAGYSPNVLNFENDVHDGYVIIDKIKDLVPEECKVNWKKVDGWAPPGSIAPKLYQYDGIIHAPMGIHRDGVTVTTGGAKPITIPPENTLWYPLLMENGDYYGRKLLRPAFPAWYFSQIIHLFANRYYERFGEPVPIGRSNFDDVVDTGNGTTIDGKTAMENILTSLRNRSVVVLPSDRDPVTKEYDYDIEYLESQMRGADFERYMSRLDEEMSLAVFTPILLFRTANVGSYNLGQAHLRIFLWMLNHVAGDLKYFLQRYVVDRLHDINFGPKAPRAEWVYRNLGKDDPQLYAQLMQALVSGGQAMPDLDELGTAIGLTLNEVKQVTEPLDETTLDPSKASLGDLPEAKPVVQPGGGTSRPSNQKVAKNKPAPTVIARRPDSLDGVRHFMGEAVARAYATVSNGRVPPGLAYRNNVVNALVNSGADTHTAMEMTDHIFGTVNRVLPELHEALADRPERFRDVLGNVVEAALESA